MEVPRAIAAEDRFSRTRTKCQPDRKASAFTAPLGRRHQSQGSGYSSKPPPWSPTRGQIFERLALDFLQPLEMHLPEVHHHSGGLCGLVWRASVATHSPQAPVSGSCSRGSNGGSEDSPGSPGGGRQRRIWRHRRRVRSRAGRDAAWRSLRALSRAAPRHRMGCRWRPIRCDSQPCESDPGRLGQMPPIGPRGFLISLSRGDLPQERERERAAPTSDARTHRGGGICRGEPLVCGLAPPLLGCDTGSEAAIPTGSGPCSAPPHTGMIQRGRLRARAR